MSAEEPASTAATDLAQLQEDLATHAKAKDPRTAEAMRSVPRHLFLPGVPPREAYTDEAIVTKRDSDGLPVSSSSQPGLMAHMLDELDLAPGHRVLEIGAGTGYNAALIAHVVGLSGQVVTVDLDEDLTAAARDHLRQAGYPEVIVRTGDGAEGYREHAPYDRIIATVALSDLPPAWLEQVTGDALIVLPFDVRGAQVLVTLAREGSHWASRSVSPCGFIRMRGVLTGTSRSVPLGNGVSLQLPGECRTDRAELAQALAAPSVTEPTGVIVSAPRVMWGLNLWLSVTDLRSAELTEEIVPGQATQLPQTPLRAKGFSATYGIVTEHGIAVIGGVGKDSELTAIGFGEDAAALASDLAAAVRAWAAAGRSGTEGLHIDAYPRDASPAGARPEPPDPPAGLIIDRPWTRFAVYRVPLIVADHLEVEQKYEAEAGFTLPSLDALPGVAGVTEPEVYQLDATYYDTDDLALNRSKVTLRRRTGGTDEGWHLKLPVRADVRQEIQEPLGTGTEVPLRLVARVEDLTAGQPLHPIASLSSERTVRRLISNAGAVLAEIADDQVTARRLPASTEPASAEPASAAPLVWREIEVEAGEAGETGPSDLLAAAGKLLREAGARPARSASKLGRLLAQ
jgi:protein-L-isoaspartate(D-aspartate) O-methyltransferase